MATLTKPSPGYWQQVGSYLKPFQKRTAEYVFRRMFLDKNPSHRFLVADEVGLGKTIVARGVIAKAVDHLIAELRSQGVARPVRIVYICSNSDIARQNLRRLDLTDGEWKAVPTRLTMLPLEPKLYAGDGGNDISLIAFTPGTSFTPGRNIGDYRERALIYGMLQEIWDIPGRGPQNVLQGKKGKDNWREYLRTEVKKYKISPTIIARFREALRDNQNNLQVRFMALSDKFRYPRKRANIPDDEISERQALVGELREVLAAVCVTELAPDIVILDEFQRFRNLLNPDTEEGDLASHLFDYGGAKTLLLSATPYKMYTIFGEEGDNHYDDFLKTTGFLFGDDQVESKFRLLLAQYRQSLQGVIRGDCQMKVFAKSSKDVQDALRMVMVRTERLALTHDRNGMVRDQKICHAVKSSEIRQFLFADKLSREIGGRDSIEFSKSSPYLANLMDVDYDVKKKLELSINKSDQVAPLFRKYADCLMKYKTIERYQKLPLGNMRMTALVDTLVRKGAWRLLWVPASLPYYQPSGVFGQPGLSEYTKTLVFSEWRVVPKAIAMLASYEAERLAAEDANRTSDYSEARRQGRLIRFGYGETQSGMTFFNLFYPSLSLALEIDPLVIAAEKGVLSYQAMLTEVRTLIQSMLNSAGFRQSKAKPADDRWYWAAAILLDQAIIRRKHVRHVHWNTPDQFKDEWMNLFKETEEDDQGEDRQVVQNIEHFLGIVDMNLGPYPEDLPDVLATVALGSPAVIALRSLNRQFEQNGLSSEPTKTLMLRATKIGLGFRSLFNRIEAMDIVRSSSEMPVYWQQVLDYCARGNLQSVMDEYVHMLRESIGTQSQQADVASEGIAQEITDMLRLRPASLTFDQYEIPRGKQKIVTSRHSVRCRFGLRFGIQRDENGQETSREDHVRHAFNSPFPPFILASTSIGQEGLDFHVFCHRVWHWNLPHNPIDLEQREGRVHRYKGHVVRRNLARQFGLPTPKNLKRYPDPWECLFREAEKNCTDKSGLEPFWIINGMHHAKIERIICNFPLSWEESRIDDLKRTLALYRLVLGQPRQDDMVQEILNCGGDPDVMQQILNKRICLEPPNS